MACDPKQQQKPNQLQTETEDKFTFTAAEIKSQDLMTKESEPFTLFSITTAFSASLIKGKKNFK